MAAEYVLKEGNENVMLCERGIRTFETAYRFTLDLTGDPGAQGAHAPAGDRRPEPRRRAPRARRAAVAGRRRGRAPTASSSRCTRSPTRRSATARSSCATTASPTTRPRSSRPPRWPARSCSAAVATRRERRRRRRRADRRVGRPGRARARSARTSSAGTPSPRGRRARARGDRRRRRRRSRRSARRGRRVRRGAGGALAGRRARRAARRRPGLRGHATSARPSARSSTPRRRRASSAATRSPGAEAAGVEHARADLFDGATWYLTPTARTDGHAATSACTGSSAASARAPSVDRRRRARPPDGRASRTCRTCSPTCWSTQATRALERRGVPAIGAELPRRDARRRRQPAAVGAASTPPTARRWPRRSTRRSRSSAARATRCAAGGDAAASGRQAVAPSDRRALLEERRRRAAPQRELRVVVPNRPGVIAELALALGRAGINISDMSLSPVAGHARSGEVDALGRRRPTPTAPTTLIGELGSPVALMNVDASTRHAACAATSRRRRTSRSRIAPRCSARWPSEPVRITDYLDAEDTNSTLDAVAGARRAGRGAPDELVIRGTGLREAREPERADRRRQRRHAHAAAARLAGRRRRGAAFDARRRRVDPPAPGRPHRRAAARDGRARSRRTDGRFPPFTVHGARLRAIALRAARGQRAGEVVRAARRAGGRRRDDGHRAGAQPRPHRADARRAPAWPSTATAATSRSSTPTSCARAGSARARRPVARPRS